MTEAETIAALRDYITEPSTTPISDANLKLRYLLPGAYALNRVVKYFYKDSTLAVVEGDVEVAQPEDFIEAVWLELGTTLLDRIDDEQLQQIGNWRRLDKGMPSRWYAYGGKIGFDCPLNDEAQTLTCTLRHVASPTISTTPGFDLLATQDHYIPCLYAAEMWLVAHGGDLNFARAREFRRIADEEAKRVMGFYAARRLMRGP